MSLQNGYPENKFVIRKIQYITPVAFPFSVLDAETFHVAQEIDEEAFAQASWSEKNQGILGQGNKRMEIMVKSAR